MQTNFLPVSLFHVGSEQTTREALGFHGDLAVAVRRVNNRSFA